MKKQLIYFATLLALLFLASCSVDPVTDEEFKEAIGWGNYEFKDSPPDSSEQLPMGSLRYVGQIPDGTSAKIPTCKGEKPFYGHFDLIDANGSLWTREGLLTEINGKWISEIDSLPYGQYEVVETMLMSEQGDTLYSIPKSTDVDFHDYATTILPISIEIGETPKTINGTALCYVPGEKPDESELFVGLEFLELSTMYIYITANVPDATDNNNCIYWFIIKVDGQIKTYRFIVDGPTRFEALVPKKYETLSIETYSVNPNDSPPVQIVTFTSEDPFDAESDGPIIFDKCF